MLRKLHDLLSVRMPFLAGEPVKVKKLQQIVEKLVDSFAPKLSDDQLRQLLDGALLKTDWKKYKNGRFKYTYKVIPQSLIYKKKRTPSRRGR